LRKNMFCATHVFVCGNFVPSGPAYQFQERMKMPSGINRRDNVKLVICAKRSARNRRSIYLPVVSYGAKFVFKLLWQLVIASKWRDLSRGTSRPREIEVASPR